MDRLGFLLAVVVALLILIPLTAHCQDALSEADRREVLLRLGELQIDRQRLSLQDAYIQRDKEQDERERALATRELSAEKSATALAQKEAALWKSQSDTWEASYRALTKGKGAGYTICKIFTLGLAHCQ